MAKTALLFMPVLQFFDDSGNELNGGTLTFSEAGTSTLKDTYADSAQAVTNPNPITLDSAGRPDNSGSPIQIWLDGSYKLVVKDSSGSTIRTEDNLTALAEATGYAAKTTDYTITLADYGKLINVDASSANTTVTLPAAATAGSGFQVSVGKSDSGDNLVTIDGNGSETIDGSTTYVLTMQYDSATLHSDGSNWILTSKKDGGVTLVDGGTGASSVSQTSPGILLAAHNMNATSKYTPVLKFGSRDDDFTTTNPKWMAGVAGFAEESYGSDTASGMGLDFFITANGSGATPTPTVALQIEHTGNVILPAGNLTVTDEDSRTNSIDDVLTLTSTTDGTPAAGIGTGIVFNAESAGESPSNFGRLAFRATDVTDTSEDTTFDISTRTAGASLDVAYSFVKTSNKSITFTQAASSDRTYTLSDNDATLGAGWEKVSETVASSSASVAFTGLSTDYRAYRVVMHNILPATDATALYLTVSNDNGSSYASTGYYFGKDAISSGGTANDSADNAAQFSIESDLSNATAEFLCGEVMFFNPDEAKRGQFLWHVAGFNSSALGKLSTGGGIVLTTSVDAIKFTMASGNIADGTFTLYGLRG